jgi:predicted secreted protein
VFLIENGAPPTTGQQKRKFMTTTVASSVFIASLILFLGGVLARVLGHWLRALRPPANRVMTVFGIFAIASWYVLSTHEPPSCKQLYEYDAGPAATCMYRHLRTPAAQEI